MKKRAVITGVGIICGLANNSSEFEKKIFLNNTGIDNISLFDASRMRSQKASEVKQEIAKEDDVERLEQFAKIALNEAIEDSGVFKRQTRIENKRISLSFATSLAGNEKVMDRLNVVGEQRKPLISHCPNFLNRIKNIAKINTFSFVTTTACASGSGAAGLAYEIIANDLSDIVILGGSDSLTQFASTGFHSLKSLSSSICKPFDVDRNGINIGEGAAFLIVEEYEHAKDRGAYIYGELVGYGICNDAYHMTSPHPEACGAIRSMKMALKDFEEKIDYVNAHGTATPINDQVEMKAIENVLGNQDGDVFVSSNKSMVGHCLGAAGAIELVASVLAIKHNMVPLNYNLVNPISSDESKLKIVREENKKAEVNTVLSNSFAFGGNTASIVVKRIEASINNELGVI
ncbi:beta-ketoacyl-[acyl-carrier-protein] synthase family protein [Paenibacillus albiflavus]|uniref:Beta-ketoacyl-[acyl-carrier-protein] synthase family protein n=1 Tax=Paenibacillus albiflavus TaxID=2545760 RepID=A0A4R4EBB8_9BACL|nr:beta-ketoacyl-[acyl-carrier-protein] synthase family protein [Paenibacillus albiflavus]TCZ77174.1 beta-ketoacyl-[acyl-carrier-protein] synthase family protein [Paenibacillus albiflavus]